MISTTIEVNFSALYSELMAVNFMRAAKRPFGARPTTAVLNPLLTKGDPHLPPQFRAGYSRPLEDELGRVLARLTQNGRIDTDIVETLTGCVYQHADPKLTPQLHRFLAVISNLYRSFLDKSKRANLQIPLRETLPPLATFQSDPSSGPFTITYETVAALSGGKLGVVSMPWTFADHPLLYGSLAHETGGHDVIHADASLMPELRAQVRSLFTGADAWIGVLWDYWMDEAAADIYGVMNIGPSFGYNLALLLAVFIAQASNRPKSAAPVLRTETGADEGGLDPHPTDILRLALVQGAVGTLAGLAEATRAAYNDRIMRLADALAPNAATVALNGPLRTSDGRSLNLQKAVSLSTMQEAARRVGAMIATVRLGALADHSVQDIETWDDADENTAQIIAGRLGTGSSIVGVGDDAQIIAGLTLAAIANPSAYATLSKLASDALDDSFSSDPYWGFEPRDQMVLKPVTHRANPEVKVDPFAERVIDYNPLEDDAAVHFAAAAVTKHAIASIPWPSGKAPRRDSSFAYAGSDAPLPKADIVMVTWTSAEANAMSAVLTPDVWQCRQRITPGLHGTSIRTNGIPNSPVVPPGGHRRQKSITSASTCRS